MYCEFVTNYIIETESYQNGAVDCMTVDAVDVLTTIC